MERKIAVILAAGMGTRLQPETQHMPKCMVTVGAKPILQYQLEMLEESEFDTVVIVVGYHAQVVRSWLSDHATRLNTVIVENRKFSTTNNMYSAYLALERISDWSFDVCYIMNGDVVYERGFLDGVAGDNSGIFVDSSLYLTEAMKVAVDGDDTVKRISKTLGEKESRAVSVDMYRFSKNDTNTLYEHICSTIDRGRVTEWTEVALDELSRNGKLKMKLLDRTGYLWWEIDDLVDKQRALERMKIDLFRPELSNRKLFVFDIDGTLLLGERAVDGAAELLDMLHERGHRVAFVTNNSSLTNADHIARINRVLGKAYSSEKVISSLDHLQTYMKSTEGQVPLIYCLLNERVKTMLRENGLQLTEGLPSGPIVVGFDTELTYEKLKRACTYVQEGKPYILVHRDLRCPTEYGYIPDAGSIGGVIESVTQVGPSYVCGKPEPDFLRLVAEKFGSGIDQMVYVGDRLYTDMKMAEALGVIGIVIDTGETCFDAYFEQYGNCPETPVLFFDSMTFLCHYLRRLK